MITFIATAYKETTESIIFINSLLLQTNSDWKLVIYCDEYNEYINNYVKYLNDSRIKIMVNDQSKGYWGHYNRIEALNHVDTEFVLQTSIQDYYIPTTVQEVFNYRFYDFIYFNLIHNKFNYNVLNTELVRCKIDWGSFIVKTKIAKEVGIKYPQSPHCDGIYVEDLIKYNNIKIIKINKILTVHN
jgi:hypothetical protein